MDATKLTKVEAEVHNKIIDEQTNSETNITKDQLEEVVKQLKEGQK